MIMQTVKIRNLIIGEGLPKICVPITGTTEKEILKEAALIHTLPADLAEWRADWYEEASDLNQVTKTAGKLRELLGELPLLFTFRTKAEGGRLAITSEAYERLNLAAAKSGDVDLVDVEAFSTDLAVDTFIHKLQKENVKVIASNHDFEKTPPKDEIVRRLCTMQELGADIAKIAVMPRTKEDVLTLISATLKMQTNYARCPLVTMSMSGMGAVSRIIGEFSGSAITFGAAAKASAPGQIEACELAQLRKAVHNSLRA